MVKLNAVVSTKADKPVDFTQWLEALRANDRGLDIERIRGAYQFLKDAGVREQALEQGLALARFASELNLDTESVMAGLCYRTVRDNLADSRLIESEFGAQVRSLVDAMIDMSRTSILELDDPKLLSSQRRDQAANVRRMLIAMIDDVRAAVLKLAERVLALRNALSASDDRRRRIALEAQQIFAPLAHRLGMAQVKWALEDLSLRYLHEDAYRSIAQRLEGRREEREAQIQQLVGQLDSLCRNSGIDAQVSGRAKHIYSIWRKMASKGVDFDEVLDVQAVRIVVPTVKDCYFALGLIHGQWRHIEHEFDDYIANPKDNGYQSLHTAVMLAEGAPLEVQIRTEEMHAEAELGVCAHWHYKRPGTDDDDGITDKLNWLRQVLELQEEAGGLESLGESLGVALETERIYVRTPKGHVVDLKVGATPVDFAYRIHTDIGHRCRGALVNGRPVPLDTSLANGQVVEIVTGQNAQPLPNWLDSDAGFVRTARARAKINAFWREASSHPELLDDQILKIARALNLDAERVKRWLRESSAQSVGQNAQFTLAALAKGSDELSKLLQTRIQADKPVRDLESLRIVCRDRRGLVSEVIQALHAGGADVVRTEATTTDGLVKMNMSVRLESAAALVACISALFELPAVEQVERI